MLKYFHFSSSFHCVIFSFIAEISKPDSCLFYYFFIFYDCLRWQQKEEKKLIDFRSVCDAFFHSHVFKIQFQFQFQIEEKVILVFFFFACQSNLLMIHDWRAIFYYYLKMEKEVRNSIRRNTWKSQFQF